MAAKRTGNPTPLDLNEWITVREGAALTNYNEAYVRHLAKEGRIQSRKVASALLLSRTSLLAYKAEMDALGTKRFSKTRAKRYPSKARSGATKRAVKESAGSAPYTAELQVRSIFDLPFMSKEELRARNQAAIALLSEWQAETGEAAQDQIETGQLLMTSLRENGLRFHTFPEWGDDEGDNVEADDSARELGNVTETTHP